MRLPLLSGREVAIFLLVQCVSAQIPTNIPQCLQGCISRSNSECDSNNISCVCRLASGDFLPDVVQCYQSSCDDKFDINVLIAALQNVCQLFSSPISTGAIESAATAGESSDATLATVVTAEITTSDGDLIGIMPTIHTVGDYIATTIVGLTTNDAGQTYTVAVPESYNTATTITGQPFIVVASTPIISRPRPVPLGSSSAVVSSQTVTSTDRTLDASSTSVQAAPTEPSSTTGPSTTTLPASSTGVATPASAVSTSSSPISSSASSTTITGDGTLFTPQADGSVLKARSVMMLTIGLIVVLYWW